MPKKNPSTDHTGATFPSTAAMCRHWGVDVHLYNARRNKGWSVRRALTEPVAESMEVTDHLGNSYSTVAEMCCVWEVPHRVYKERLRDGWDKESALTVPC